MSKLDLRTRESMLAGGERGPALQRPYRDRIIAAKQSKLPEYLLLALRTPREKRTEGQTLNAIQRIDPDNKYLWRMPRRRLEAEAIRDNILAVAGTLDRRIGGPGVYPYIDPALWQGSSGRKWPGRPDSDPSTWRRSIYVFSKRSIPLPILEVFDKSDAVGSCSRRNSSISAPQALILMFMAQRIQTEGASKVDRAFQLALSRLPTQSERERAQAFIAATPEGLVDFRQTLLNTNEFVYIP